MDSLRRNTVFILAVVAGAGCSFEEAVDILMTTGPVEAEAEYINPPADRTVAPGTPLRMDLSWGAPCGKNGSCKHQDFGVEIVCGGVKCEVEPMEDIVPSTSGLGYFGWAGFHVTPLHEGTLKVSVKMIREGDGEVQRFELVPITVNNP